MRFDPKNRLFSAPALLIGLFCICAVLLARAQDTAAPNTSPQAQDSVEELVGRIALYPDDLDVQVGCLIGTDDKRNGQRFTDQVSQV